MRDRAFSSAAIATLALGVGAITALSAIVAGVLLAPLPYKDPERLVAVLHGASFSSPVYPADFLDPRARKRRQHVADAGRVRRARDSRFGVWVHDARVTDGRQGAQFLARIRDLLTRPGDL